MTRARLAAIDLPDFGMPDEAPELAASLYQARLERLRARAREAGFDRLVVWADREHSANLSYLTGFDPRFEEAVLIVGAEGEPAILVGNENWGTAGAAPLTMRRHRFQAKPRAPVPTSASEVGSGTWTSPRVQLPIEPVSPGALSETVKVQVPAEFKPAKTLKLWTNSPEPAGDVKMLFVGR